MWYASRIGPIQKFSILFNLMAKVSAISTFFFKRKENEKYGELRRVAQGNFTSMPSQNCT
jgi:hypothetical protein